MQYRVFGNTGCEISALGYGCMRFPTTDNTPGSANIDKEQAIRLIRHAIDNGVNYVDTAYNYHGGQSEIVVGEALKDGYRDKTYLATKCPVWLVKEPADFDRLLDEQLGKLQTDHIDFYLLHALDWERFEQTIIPCGLVDKMVEAKKAGKIRYMGFSFHDSLDSFKKMVDYTDLWDFCQIQYNYINTDYQAGMEGLHYAAAKGLGVVIMEPLLGGRLAVAPAQVAPMVPAGRPAVQWALDWLWDQKEVGLLLSGMGTMEMVDQNMAYADASYVGKVPEAERPLYAKAKEIFETMAIVPCTKCQYCMPCPFGVDIPAVYDAYNKTASLGLRKARSIYAELQGKADLCQACGACEHHCPQHICSTELMPKIAEVFAE
ncbi:MAG: aldo/keto reductase [Lachnospiraceae bacterium]|nr:aldo/keto reductase [Lachnospiraceae bacterium]